MVRHPEHGEVPLPLGEGGRRPGEGELAASLRALIRRFAAPSPRGRRAALGVTAILAAAVAALTIGAQSSPDLPPLMRQTQAEADAKSPGCISCHKGIEPMHASAAVKLACTDCHGGNGTATTKEAAHVKP